MKRIQAFLIILAAMLAGASQAVGQVVSPYLADFNTPITTNTSSSGDDNRDFKVSAGWNHKVGYVEVGWSSSKRYIPYTYHEDKGVDNSGCLQSGINYFYDSYEGEDYYVENDLLITPPITGVASLQVKLFNATGYVKFFKVTKSGDSFDKGEEIIPTTTTEPNTSDWLTVTLPAQPAGTLIGIQSTYAYMDNFSAESANLNKQPSLKVASVEPNTAQTIAADAEGNFTVTFNAMVTNNGEIDFTAGTENYSLSLVKYIEGGQSKDDHDLLVTQDITEDLAVNATTTSPIELTANLNTATYPEALTSGILFRIYENITGTYLATKNVKVIAYEPGIQVSTKVGNSTTTYTDGQEMYFGTSQAAVSQDVTITNTGGAPLEITGVTCPEGFSTSLAPQSVEALNSAVFSITMEAASIGEKTGNFVIASNAGNFTLSLKGIIADPDKYFVDFESDESVAGMYFESIGDGYSTYGWRSKYTNDKGYPANTYSARSALGYSGENIGPFKMVTPLLEVAEGDVMTFDASRDYNPTQMKIYYSSDRKNWIELRTLSTSASNADDLLIDEPAPKYNKAFKQFTIDQIPAGQWYVAFEHYGTDNAKGDVLVDNIFGYKKVDVERDVVIVKSDIKENGEVNSEMTASATLRNILAEKVNADDYTVRLYFDDAVQAEAESVDIEGPAFDANGINRSNDANFNFTFTPHVAGTFAARIEVEFSDGQIISSVPVNVTIAEEIYTKTERIGGEPVDVSYYIPFDVYDNNGESDNIYLPADMNGLSEGTVIKSISLKGISSNSYGTKSFGVKVWIGETEDTQFTNESGSYNLLERTNDNLYYEGTVVFGSAGNESEHATIATLVLNKPYTYQGGNLNVYLQALGSSYSSTKFEVARTTNPQSVYRYSYSSASAMANQSFNTLGSYYLPVLYVGIETSPKTVSGKVTNKETGLGMEDVEVRAENGNVLYSAITDAEGNYSVSIMKDDREYELKASLNGFFPFAQTVSVADDSQIVNIELEEANGLFIDEYDIPEEGMINFPIKATAKVSNYTLDPIDAASYTAKLFVGGEAVAEAESVDLSSGEGTEFVFSYTPHEVGTLPAYIEFAQGENSVATENVDIVVKEEVVGGEMQIGNAGGRNTYIQAPIGFYYKNHWSDIVYTPEMLEKYGVTPGAKITAITYKMYSESPKDQLNIKVSAWAGMSDAGADFTPGDVDLETMQQPLNEEEYTISTAGASSVNPIEYLFTFNLEQPLVYDGEKSLRVVLKSEDATYVGSQYFYYDTEYQTASINYSDSPLSSFKTSKTNTPVVFLSVAGGTDVTGKVLDKASNEPIANASVKLRSNDIWYTGQSDEEGNYSITIKQTENDFTIEATAEGYAMCIMPFGTPSDDNNTKTILLDTPKTVSGTVTDARSGNGIADVAITLTSDNEYEWSATTDADGKYSITVDVLGIDYTMSISAGEAYEPVDNVSISAESLEDNIEQNFELNTIAKQLYGHVYSNGEPVSGATVTASCDEVTITATTDEDGNYTLMLENPALSYSVTAEADGYLTEVQSVEGITEDTELNFELNVDAIANTSRNLNSGDFRIENGVVILNGNGNIYDLEGRLVKEVRAAGETRVNLKRGVYVINGVKVTVK